MLLNASKILFDYKYRVLITIFFIVFSPFFSENIQNYIALILIFTIGILHGSNDLKLIQKKTKNFTKKYFFVVLFFYVLVVIIGILIFFIYPTFGLIAFIIFSAFHFGEQHLKNFQVNSRNKIPIFMFYISYGLIILNLLFYLEFEDVNEVIKLISNFDIKKYQIFYILILSTLSYIFSIIFLNITFKIWNEFLLIALLCFLFNSSNLILGFSIYFVFWHSFPSVKDQIIYLYGNFEYYNLIEYTKSSFLYWLISLFAMFIAYNFLDFREDYFLPLFFSFLAAITFPHAIVIGSLK
tara:strand:+ start:125762 stop:126649 length:888 start_codon:yes stop_codon:yes gene_type:complete